MLTKLIKIIVALLLVVIISAVVFVSVFDANEYKPEIIAQVEQATGRDFSIEGDIGLTLYPWIGLKLEKTSLGNAKGFSQNSFASFEQMNVKVNVLPLLKKSIEINKIQLRGLQLSLEVDANGHNNWEDLSKPEKNTASTTHESDVEKKVKDSPSQVSDARESDPSQTSQSFALKSLKVEGLEFVNASITYVDKVAGSTTTVSDLNLQTGEIQFDLPVDIQFRAHIENSQPVLDSQVDMTTALTFNQTFSLFTLRDFLLTVAVKANDMVKQDVDLVVKAKTDVDMEKQLINVEQLQIDVLDVSTFVDMRITQFLDAPVIKGKVSVAEFDARALSKKLGVVLPDMAKKNALSKVSLSSKFEKLQQLLLHEIDIKIDESTLTGQFRVQDLKKQSIRYDLLLDKINLNDYMPPVVAESDAKKINNAEASVPVVSSKTHVSQAGQVKSAGDEVIELPVKMLRALDINGVFKVSALHIQNLDVSDVLITTKAANGVINIEPINLNVLDGNIDAGVRVDVRKKMPRYATDLTVKNVQAGPLVNPSLKNAMGDKPMTLTGAVNVVATIKSQGNTVNALKKKAKGKVTLDMNKTSVKGFDPEYLVRSSIADYLDAKGLSSLASVRSEYEPRKVTVFDTIHDTANIANGKVTTKDFLMSSTRVVIKASGAANIMNNTMDVMSSVKLARSKTALEKILTKPLFVRVHGPFDTLEYDVDTQKLSDNVGDVLQDEAKAKIDAEKQRLKEKANKEIEKQKKNLGDKLMNKFKGLF